MGIRPSFCLGRILSYVSSGLWKLWVLVVDLSRGHNFIADRNNFLGVYHLLYSTFQAPVLLILDSFNCLAFDFIVHEEYGKDPL
jgi:hypothetical protein